MDKSIRSRYEFSEITKRFVVVRQNGKCAVCGSPLNLRQVQFHHVVAAQSAYLLGMNKEVIKHTDNCVAVCGEDENNAASSCHQAAHNGDFRNGALAEGPFFKYSHGNNKAGHNAWCRHIEFIWSTRK